MRAHTQPQRVLQRVCLRGTATAKLAAYFYLAYLYAANRPAGTREALPGSMIIPSLNEESRSDVAGLAPCRSFEIARCFGPSPQSNRVFATKIVTTKNPSSVRQHLPQGAHVSLAY